MAHVSWLMEIAAAALFSKGFDQVLLVVVELTRCAYVHVGLASEFSARDSVLIYRNKIKNSRD